MPDPLYEKELLADGRILSFRFSSTGAEAAETWFSEVTSIYDEWQAAHKPMLTLFDLSNSGAQLSPEALKHAHDISHMYPDAPGKTAFLVSGHDSTITLKAMMEHLLEKTRPAQLFTNRDEAIAWLLSP